MISIFYRRWQSISRGETVRPGAAIRDRFQAAVALTDREHWAFIEAMQNDPLAVKAYEDADCIVYTIPRTEGAGDGIRPEQD